VQAINVRTEAKSLRKNILWHITREGCNVLKCGGERQPFGAHGSHHLEAASVLAGTGNIQPFVWFRSIPKTSGFFFFYYSLFETEEEFKAPCVSFWTKRVKLYSGKLLYQVT
jgi:hypothetical protein